MVVTFHACDTPTTHPPDAFGASACALRVAQWNLDAHPLTPTIEPRRSLVKVRARSPPRGLSPLVGRAAEPSPTASLPARGSRLGKATLPAC